MLVLLNSEVRVIQKSYSKVSARQRKKISTHLVWEYPTHDYFIDCEEARKVGLHVNEATQDIQSLLDELNDCYGKQSCWGIALPEPKTQGTNGGTKNVTEAEKVLQEVSGDGNGK